MADDRRFDAVLPGHVLLGHVIPSSPGDLNPNFGVEPVFEDAIHTTITTEWAFWDRLKILFFGCSMVRVEVQTEHVVGRVESESSAWTPPIFPGRSVPMSHEPDLEENPIHG